MTRAKYQKATERICPLGRAFELLKKQKITLAIHSANPDFDADINLMLRLGLIFMNHWLVQSAEFVVAALEYPNDSQEEIGQKLGINQAAVSRRRKRAQFDLLLDLDAHFRKKSNNSRHDLICKIAAGHLLGDFVLQPNSWVADKEDKKIKSIYLYKHIAIHGLLIFLIVAQSDFWWAVLVLTVLHAH
jgi:hypothetical protein